ncbi:MAG: HDOD domain-containing protein [Cellulomonadaceae bacterium]|nr:HDOD domain-containing protein [Cellulomonadaceae bacterium]
MASSYLDHAYEPDPGSGVGLADPGQVVTCRERVLAPDGAVLGYALTLVRVAADGSPVETDDGGADPELHRQYVRLDLLNLVADRVAFIPGTPQMLEGSLPEHGGFIHLVVDLPERFEQERDAYRRLVALRASGVELCLHGYTGTALQKVLLPLVAFVTVEPASFAELPSLVSSAHAVGTRVLASGVRDAASRELCVGAGVDGLRGGEAVRADPDEQRGLHASQVQCLLALQLLVGGDVDLDQVASIIQVDPALTFGVLHLVNSGAFALGHGVETVQQALVLLGVRQVTTLIVALALDATPDPMDSLWRILARARTCEALAAEPAGYTVGLLSALVAELEVPADVVLDQIGVTLPVATAVRRLEGPLGRVLAAVLAHEHHDNVCVCRAGFTPAVVSSVYVRCLAESLATARSATRAS